MAYPQKDHASRKGRPGSGHRSFLAYAVFGLAAVMSSLFVCRRAEASRPLSWHAERVQQVVRGDETDRLLQYALPSERELGLDPSSFEALLSYWKEATGCKPSNFQSPLFAANEEDSEAILDLNFVTSNGQPTAINLEIERIEGKPFMKLVFPFLFPALRALGDSNYGDVMEPERTFRIVSDGFRKEAERLEQMGLRGCVIEDNAGHRTMTWSQMSDWYKALADHRATKSNSD